MAEPRASDIELCAVINAYWMERGISANARVVLLWKSVCDKYQRTRIASDLDGREKAA